MNIKEAVEIFKQHQKGNVKKNTLRSYGKLLTSCRCDLLNNSSFL
ncbi:MAG TPA: hypothetical protein VMB78_10135 [Dissulfurispiraceae bacterium]|nr:hypothetical protein [Dissulfurispiraceae bacterium]